jgi:hypothetical protein
VIGFVVAIATLANIQTLSKNILIELLFLVVVFGEQVVVVMLIVGVVCE